MTKSNSISLRKQLKIYLPFTINGIKQNFAYKGRFYLFMIARLFSVFVTYYLWMAIFDSSVNATLGGFTRNEMLTYIFMSYISSNIVYISAAREIGNDVYDGSIAMNLIKPIKYRTKLFFQSLGDVIYRLIMPSLLLWIGLEIYKVAYLGTEMTSVVNILLFLVSNIFSFLIYFLFDFCFSLLAFYTTYIWGMSIAKNAVLSFLTGQLIPLTFFPSTMQKFFDYLPFKSMNYTPVMIYLGKLGGASNVAKQLLIQFIWVAILFTLGNYFWSKVTKRLIVLGG